MLSHASNKIRIILACLVALMLAGCTLSSEPSDVENDGSDQDTEIPQLVIDGAAECLISRIGESFFNEYFSYQPERSRFIPPDSYCIDHPDQCGPWLLDPHYRVVFVFRISEKPFVDELIEIHVDTLGVVLTDSGRIPLPDCIVNPTECDFPIDEEQAQQIAQDAGLADGIKPWVASFHWDFRQETFVWTVQNTTHEDLFSGGGTWISIDANTGDFIEEGGWMWMTGIGPIYQLQDDKILTSAFIPLKREQTMIQLYIASLHS